MLPNLQEEITEKILFQLCSGYSYLYNTGKMTGHWEDMRGTALAGIALELKEQPSSHWLRVIRRWLESSQIKEGEVSGSWNEEIWDTSMSILALKSFEISSRDPIIKLSVDWINSLYKINKRNNWHDEPWETCWALIAVLTTGVIPDNFDVNEPITWLLDFQGEDGKIIAPHYTAYYLLIWDKLNKTNIDEIQYNFYTEKKKLCSAYLVKLLADSDEETLWSGEAWANGQILWALCLVNDFPLDDVTLMKKTVNWFEKKQTKEGNWSDIEDTASAIIGQYKLIELIYKHSIQYKGKNIKSILQKRLPCPNIYIKKPFIEKHVDTGGISINLNNRTIKIIVLIGTIAAGLSTFFSLLEYIYKILKDVR